MSPTTYDLVAIGRDGEDVPLGPVIGRQTAIEIMVKGNAAGARLWAVEPVCRDGFTIPSAKGRAHRIAEAVLIPVAGALAFALFAAAVLF
jgi:hypothetical protein